MISQHNMPVSVSTADYDAVVADIYEASLSPSHWDVALTNLVSRFGRPRWDVAMLLWERVTPPGGRFIGNSGVHPMAQSGYLAMFAGRNAWSEQGHGLPIGTVVHSDWLVAREDFRQSPFFRDYLAMFEMEVAVIASLDRDRSDHMGLCLPGPDNGSVELLETATRMLVPHIQRAVRIARRIGEAEIGQSTARAALDVAPSPVWMLTEGLELLYANPQADALAKAFRLYDSAGNLRFGKAELQDELRALANPDVNRHCFGFVLETPDGIDMPSATILAMRVDPAKTTAASGGQARLMLIGSQARKLTDGMIEQMREWFGMTPAEARLAILLGDGGRLEDYCRIRAVSLNAAKFLLKGVFAKTGVTRQADLVHRLQQTPIAWRHTLPIADLPPPLG